MGWSCSAGSQRAEKGERVGVLPLLGNGRTAVGPALPCCRRRREIHSDPWLRFNRCSLYIARLRVETPAVVTWRDGSHAKFEFLRRWVLVRASALSFAPFLWNSRPCRVGRAEGLVCVPLCRLLSWNGPHIDIVGRETQGSRGTGDRLVRRPSRGR